MSFSPRELSVRVLTMNAHKGFGLLNRRFVLHELRAAVRAVDADIVFLQEVHGEHHEHSKRHGNWPAGTQYEFMADDIWPDFAYGRNAVYPAGDHGNAVLSRFPIVGWENRDVSVDRHEKRGLLHCTLQVPGRDAPLHAICVHLGLRESHRTHQLDRLADIVGTHVPASSPLVVAGDFNDWRRRAHRVLQRAGLHEVYVRAQGKAARTFPAHFPLFQLDRIYVRNARGDSPMPLPRRPWSRLSDHAPLAAEIRL